MKRVVFVAMMLIAPILSLESAFADPVTFTAKLSSEAQGQQNASPGTGSATVVMDTTPHTLQVSVPFAGLQSTTILHRVAATRPGSSGHCQTATVFIERKAPHFGRGRPL